MTTRRGFLRLLLGSPVLGMAGVVAVLGGGSRGSRGMIWHDAEQTTWTADPGAQVDVDDFLAEIQAQLAETQARRDAE